MVDREALRHAIVFPIAAKQLSNFYEIENVECEEFEHFSYRRTNMLQEQISLQWPIEVLFNVPVHGIYMFCPRDINHQHRNKRRKAHHVQGIAVKCHWKPVRTD